MAMIKTLNKYVIPAALSILPAGMDGVNARAMLLSIALQESKATFRQQVNGPAKGLWQFEINGIIGVRKHQKTAALSDDVLISLLYRVNIDNSEIVKIIEHNDILACCFARLLLYTIPTALPGRTEFDLSWGQYIAGWNPGKPNRNQWNVNYTMAWQETYNDSPMRRA